VQPPTTARSSVGPAATMAGPDWPVMRVGTLHHVILQSNTS
jgi:hypothetical protein